MAVKNRIILKKRNFRPTGKNLGEFEPSQLTPVPLTWKDSNIDSENQGNQPPSDIPQPPPPKDPNPIKKAPQDSHEQDNKSSQQDNPNPNDETDGGAPPMPFDVPQVEFTDSPETRNSDDGDTGDDSGMPGGDNAFDEPDSEEDGEGMPGDSSDDSSGDSGDSSDDASTGDSGGGRSFRDDSSDDSSNTKGSGSDAGSENSGDDSDSNNSGGGDSSNNTGSSQGGDSGNGSDDSSGSKDGITGDSGDSGDSGEEERELSDLEKQLKQLEDNRSDVSKKSEQVRQERAESEEADAKSAQDKANEIAETAAKKAAEDENATEEGKRNSRNVVSNLQSVNKPAEFSTKLTNSWRDKLEEVFLKAFGILIYEDPEALNPKIQDAPPGREAEMVVAQDIVIMLDCSGSMGAPAFREAITHIGSILKTNIDAISKNTNFHVLFWSNVFPADSDYKKIPAMRATQVVSRLREGVAQGGTDIIPAFRFLKRKGIKMPDLVVILTDGELHGESYAANFKKATTGFQSNVVWGLCRSHYGYETVMRLDPTAKREGRIIKFAK